MTREDNPEYFAHICEIIKAVYSAEHNTDLKHKIGDRLKAKEITPDEFVELVADELISATPKEEVEGFTMEETAR